MPSPSMFSRTPGTSIPPEYAAGCSILAKEAGSECPAFQSEWEPRVRKYGGHHSVTLPGRFPKIRQRTGTVKGYRPH